MSDYSNTNRFSLWGNKKKTIPEHKDFEGNTEIACPSCGVVTDYWLSGWKRKEGANPKAPALSGTVQAKEAVHKAGMEETRASVEAPPQQALAHEDFDDDLPF